MRLLRPALVAAMVLSTLSGCFLLPTADEQRASAPTSTAAAADPVPEAGDCWEGEYTSFLNWVAWRGDDAVDCEDRHQSYTYAMSNAFEDAEDAYPFGGWRLDDSAPIAYDSCRSLLGDFLGMEIAASSRLETYFFAPSAQEWHAGARWLRCDLVVLKVGSSVYDGRLERLPDDAADLREALEDEADRYDFCVDTYDGWYELGPYYSQDTLYADCSEDPMWRMLDLTTMPWEYGDPYPGDEYVVQFANDTCFGGAPAHAPFAADYPNEELWVDGWVSVSCWRYEWELPAEQASPV